MAYTLNGIGTTFYGRRDIRPDGTYVTTEWFVMFYFPILPIRSLRVRYDGPSESRFPFGSSSAEKYSVYEQTRPNWAQVLCTYVCVYGFTAWMTAWIIFTGFCYSRVAQKFNATCALAFTVVLVALSALVPFVFWHFAKRKIRLPPSVAWNTQPDGGIGSARILGTAKHGTRTRKAAVAFVVAFMLIATSFWAHKQRMPVSKRGNAGEAKLMSAAAFLDEPVTPSPLQELLTRAEKGDPDAQLSLAVNYQNGLGVSKDENESAKWYRKAAESGNPEAQNFVGVGYLMGKGVTQDEAEAARWFRKSADQGDTIGQYFLASCYENGQGVTKNSVEAVKWYRMAAEQGDTDAQVKLGLCYVSGAGVAENRTEAVKWLRMAAEAGDSNAQFNLAVFYSSRLTGRRDATGFYLGDHRDQAEALKWYRIAAEQGNPRAQYNLGVSYYEGLGVPKNFAEAVKWYQRAATQGLPDAQHNLGVCYAGGEGVPLNDIKAYEWFSIAAAQGYDLAPKARDALSRRMARAEIVEAQRRATSFIARKETPDQSKRQGEPVDWSQFEVVKASGTAFFVSDDGYLLSNFHVVRGANKVEVKTSGGFLPATVIKSDAVNDIAVLKVSGSFAALPVETSREGKLGESVFTVGFPNIGLQGFAPKLTKGDISSLSGAQDDPRQFQISVAVQPGNSGGPLVNAFGNVIGIVTARLSETAALESSGALPQNVNYAVKSSYALSLIQSVPGLANKLKAPHPAKERKFEDSVQEARAAAALVLVY